jgi:hypothetical protein
MPLQMCVANSWRHLLAWCRNLWYGGAKWWLLHVQDSDPRIASLAHLFFEELSHKVTKVRRGCRHCVLPAVYFCNTQHDSTESRSKKVASSAVQNVNPIFNLLPDILSSLGAEQVLHLCTE